MMPTEVTRTAAIDRPATISAERLDHPHRSPSIGRRLRIVHVALGTSMGGMEKLLVDFARLTCRKRFEPDFVSLQEKGVLAAEIENQHCPVVTFDKQPGFKAGLVLRLASYLRTLRPDIVHTHNAGGFVYGTISARLAGVPRLVHTQHGCRFAKSKSDIRLFRWLSRIADRMIGVSDEIRTLLISLGIDAGRTDVIRNGVDLDRFPHRGVNPDGPAILVARLSPEKNVETLIRAMKTIASAHHLSPAGIRLEIVGDGVCRSDLESLTDSLGLRGIVHFHGQRSDVASLLSRASMFVLPSLTEGISLTLLEAMASGLPVIATDVGGNREVVVADQTGLLVPTQNPAALAAAMLQMQQQPDSGQRMGRAGRHRVEQHFSLDSMIRSYQDLYIESVRQPGRELA